MPMFDIIAASAFGLESVVAGELRRLGYSELTVENGKVIFRGDESDIVKCSLWLRCAERILIKLASFKAKDFEELYQGALNIPWENMIPENGVMHVTGKSVKSDLYSVPDCQSIVKKAVIEAMRRRFHRSWFSEDGPLYKIEIALYKDIATITIDTSGAGLHKRGYRQDAGKAPLRETLAAGLVYLSRWTPERILADPMCGSGTIVIEAALMGRNIAPGLKRAFVSEDWPGNWKKLWDRYRAEANSAIKEVNLKIHASDIDRKTLRKAKDNAERAGVEEDIIFQKKPLEEFSSKKKKGCIITNPSYGERLGGEKEVIELYRKMGQVFSSLETWSFFILTSYRDFEKIYGKVSDKNRKLYNGKIKCRFYQYFGPM